MGGSGCLGGVIAFFVLFFLPALVVGEDLSWGVLLVWWGILFLIIICIYFLVKTNSCDTSKDKTYESTSKNVSDNSSRNKVRKNRYLNQYALKKYKAIFNLKNNYKDQISSIQSEQTYLDETICVNRLELSKIMSGKGKPLLITKKKWIESKKIDIQQIESLIAECLNKQQNNADVIAELQNKITKTFFYISEESNAEFESLKQALIRIKKSGCVGGINALKEHSIGSPLWATDLRNIKYKTEPYGLESGKYRFYLFPNGIWVFEGEGELVGVFTPKAIHSSIQDVKKTREVPHYTWLHTCKDGSPDRRYNYNPMITSYYSKEEYEVHSFKLWLCGCMFSCEISSNYKYQILNNAIQKYSLVIKNKDIVPVLCDLLSRCSNDENIHFIQSYIIEK